MAEGPKFHSNNYPATVDCVEVLSSNMLSC
jgi:hypothetical protein